MNNRLREVDTPAIFRVEPNSSQTFHESDEEFIE